MSEQKISPAPAASGRHDSQASIQQRIVKGSDYAGLRYKQRELERTRKHYAELKLVRSVFKYVAAGSSVLDAPCGTGRMTLLLQSLGYHCTGADLGDGVLAIAREDAQAANTGATIVKQDIMHMDFEDRHFDAVLCFRLIHHFPDADMRENLVRELCRVSDQYVAISYMSHASWNATRLKLRAMLGGRRAKKYPASAAEMNSYFARQGFTLVADECRLPLLNSLHLALYRRQDESHGG